MQLANLVNQLDAKTLLQIAYENVVKPRKQLVDTFGSFALNQYGPTLANLFLLNYSHKLWGVDPHTLSKEVSGGRLKGLDLANFIREILLGREVAPNILTALFFILSMVLVWSRMQCVKRLVKVVYILRVE